MEMPPLQRGVMSPKSRIKVCGTMYVGHGHSTLSIADTLEYHSCQQCLLGLHYLDILGLTLGSKGSLSMGS
jgi:hypothetical protein